MPFVKKVWKDLPDISTPIIAVDLNRIEDAVDEVFNTASFEPPGPNTDYDAPVDLVNVENLITLPDGVQNGFVVKVAGSSAGYGRGQPFMVLEEGTGDATDTSAAGSVLLRIDETGGIGTTGGIHIASGLRKPYAGFAALWVQPSETDIIGSFYQPPAGSTVDQTRWHSAGSAVRRASVTKDGDIVTWSTDGTSGGAALYARDGGLAVGGANYRAIFNSLGTGVTALALHGASAGGQTANLLSALAADGATVLSGISSAGSLITNADDGTNAVLLAPTNAGVFGSRAIFNTKANATIGIVAQGTTAQTGDLIRAQRGTVVKSRVSGLGRIETVASDGSTAVIILAPDDAGAFGARAIFNTGVAGTVGVVAQGQAAQTADLLRVQRGGTVESRFSGAGHFITHKTAAPADGDLAAGQMALWFDATNGAAKLMVKAKEAGGTVRTGSVALA